jgi:hypothetical protein
LIGTSKFMLSELKNLLQMFYKKKFREEEINLLSRLISTKTLKYSCECFKE